MLRWRLSLGTLIVLLLIGLVWLDHRANVPGAWLFPLAVVLALLATHEVLGLLANRGLRPIGWLVYAGNVLLLVAFWLPLAFLPLPKGEGTAWPVVALAVVVFALFCGEMRRYERPGEATGNLAAAVLAVVYVGVMFGLIVQLRMLYGVGALAALVIVVKMGDSGAYAVGKPLGRHKLTPVLSPNKTVEGAVGQLLTTALTAWAAFAWLVPLTLPAGAPPTAWWRAMLFGLLVGGAGMIGDLAESLLKRDCGSKDSSRWLPGYGGVLDLLDSLLLAAPAAWLCWTLGLV